MDVSTFWGAFWTNVFAGIAFAILLYLFQQVRYLLYLTLRFHNKTFNVYYKNNLEDVERIVTCTVCKNKIVYKGKSVRAGAKEGAFNGEFIINPINLKIGEGWQTHQSFSGFNFPKIIIKDSNTFFIETSYLKPIPEKARQFETIYQAFIWKRQSKQKSI